MRAWIGYKGDHWSIRKHCRKGSLLGQYDSEVINVCRTELCTKRTKEKGIDKRNWFRKDSEEISSIIYDRKEKEELFLRKRFITRIKGRFHVN